jgi:ketosteroid isomerase-like protein
MYANVRMALRYYEECANDDGDSTKARAVAAADELLSPDFIMLYNGAREEDGMRGVERHKEFLIAHTHSYRGERWTIEAIVADEGTVACQWRLQATHTESGNAIDLRAADFLTVADGRFTKLHRFIDIKTVDRQQQRAS